MDTKQVLQTLKEYASNISSFTIIETNNHVSMNNNGSLESFLDIHATQSKERMDNIKGFLVSWKKKNTDERTALGDIEGVKLISFETKGQSPQDIITFA